MQNSAPVRSCGVFPQPSCRRAFARFRVMARHRDGSRALVSLAESRAQAVSLAEKHRDWLDNGRKANRLGLRSQDGIVAIYTEEWIGTLTEGRWERLSPRQRGFHWAYVNRITRHESGQRSVRPGTGDVVRCVLLTEKTRKGGWRARLLGPDVAGPITNSKEVPDTMEPGRTVLLRIGGISGDGDRIQFHWLPDSNNPVEA